MKYFFLIVILLYPFFFLHAVDYNMATNNGQTISTCIGTLYDSGGSTGNYGNNQDYKVTFCSPNNQCIKIHFTQIKLELNSDYIYIYDGPDVSSPLRASYTGSIPPADLTTSSGCITIRFVSDASVNDFGFALQIACTPTCYIPPPAPSNDNPCQASILNVSGQCSYSQHTTIGATLSTIPAPLCANNFSVSDVWFQVTVPSSGRLSIALEAITQNSGGIAIYTGTNCLSLSIFTCSENSTNMPGTTNIYSSNGLQNQTVWIRFWNVGANQGTFNICAYEPPPYVVIDTITYSTPQLVQNVLVTGCLEATNVSSDAASSAIAHFNADGTILGFNSGIIMSTGNVMNASGDGSYFDPGYYSNHQNIANDLLTMAQQNAGTSSVYDVAIIEFDFKPSSDTTTFRYIFASNEYPTYNCSQYNDVFAFFVSGPGISGPYTNNSINVALIPGTNLPVCIANIHDHTGDDWGGVQLATHSITLIMIRRIIQTLQTLFYIEDLPSH
jgi:large repetitive protein